MLNKHKDAIASLALILTIGLASYATEKIAGDSFADPLLLALIIGITLRSMINFDQKKIDFFKLAPKVLIPVGIIFYALINLNFVKYSKNDPMLILLTFGVVAVYFLSIIVSGKLLKQKKEISYLVASSSGICGASAIVVTSHAMDAESDDVSVSLIAVTFVGLLALFVVLPFVGTIMGLNNEVYAIFAGTTMQYTGFVKAAMNYIPPLVEKVDVLYATKLALSVKALRYLALIVAIPVFGSVRKNKVYTLGILIIFIIGGILGSYCYGNHRSFYDELLSPIIKPIYVSLWAIAMAAIGLNADARKILSDNGLKALLMATIGFICASVFFLVMINFIR